MNEMFRLIGQTRPSRFIGKRFWEDNELPGKHVGGVGWATIVSIEPLGERTMIDLQTSTGTFIAEGFVSHNTTLSLLIDVFWLAIHPAIDGALVTEHEGNRDKNRALIRHYIESFPPGYFGDDFYIVKGKDNAKSMTFSNKSTLRFLVAGTKKKSISWAEGSGYVFAHATEVAAYSGSDGLNSFEESFAQENPDRLYLYESTAKGMNNVWHDRWKSGLADPFTKRSHFLGWWALDTNHVKRNDPRFEKYGRGARTSRERELISQVARLYEFEISPEQLCWYRWKADNLTGEDAAMLEQNNPWTADEAFVVTGHSFFQVRLLTKQLKKIYDDPDSHSFQAYRYFYGDNFFDMKLEFLDPSDQSLLEETELRVWEEPRDDGRYVIGMDPAFGDEHGDNIVISVWRCYADCLEQVAEFATNRVEPKRAAWVLAHLAGAYRDCIINLELGGGGSNVMQELDSLRAQLKSDMFAERVRSRDWEDAMGWARWYLYHRPDSMGKGYLYNFKANYDTKRAMLYGFMGSLVTNELIFHSVKLLQEMQIVRVEGTTIGAPESTSEDCKDDRVTGAGLACKAWTDWRKPELIALGLTRERVLGEERGETPLAVARINNLVYRFMQTQEQQAAEAQMAPLKTWREERGL
jgi:Terminase RNaseH-like domain